MMSKMYTNYMPTILQKKLSARAAFDVTLFAASVYVIYKYGQDMNNYMQEFIPSEASMRAEMAQMQA